MKFTVSKHPEFTEPKIGSVVVFWSKSHPGMPYIGTVKEKEYLNFEEGWYYTIQTNNGEFNGCFEVAVLSTGAEMFVDRDPF